MKEQCFFKILIISSTHHSAVVDFIEITKEIRAIRRFTSPEILIEAQNASDDKCTVI